MPREKVSGRSRNALEGRETMVDEEGIGGMSGLRGKRNGTKGKGKRMGRRGEVEINGENRGQGVT
jgi:hypothetical protein